jgi:hypothetical protein
MDKYDILEYSWVRATAVSVRFQIYLCVFKNTNKLSGAVAGKTIGVKILIVILMSINLVITSFRRIIPVLLNYGKDRTTNAIATFQQVFTRKEETSKNSGCLNIHDPSTLEPCHLTGLYRHIYIILTMCRLEKKVTIKGIQITSHVTNKRSYTTHKFHCKSW